MIQKPDAGDPTLERERVAKKATEKTFAALAKVVGSYWCPAPVARAHPRVSPIRVFA